MIVITGASSYVGKNLLKKFQKNEGVLCLVRKKIPSLGFKQEIVDFHNPESCNHFIKSKDTLIHIAGMTDGSKKEIFSVNYEITKNLIDTAKKNKTKRFIFISTAIVSIKNRGDYGNSKLLAENYLKKSGINYIILRPSLIFGPKEEKFFKKLIKLVKKNKVVPVIGNGKYNVNVVYIGDLITILKKSISTRKENKTYYVSSNHPISMDEIYKSIASSFNKKITLVHVPTSFLKSMSYFIRLIKKDFPSPEQIKRITEHPALDTKETIKDFKINFVDFRNGIKECLYDKSFNS